MKLRIRIFYGWWIVVANFIILSLIFGVGFFSFGVFFKPLATEFGWSRAAVSGAMSLFSLLWGVGAPLGGRLSDRFGPRKVMLLSAIPFGASFLLLARVQTLWQLYLIYALLALTYGGLSLVQISSLVTRWFKEQEGRAMGITFAGTSLGGLIFAPVASYLISAMGWRDTYWVLGLGSLAIMLPLILWVIKDRPQALATQSGWSGPSPPPGDERGEAASPVLALSLTKGIAPTSPPLLWTSRQMARSPAFWGISLAFFLVNLGQIGVITHQVPFLTDRGISPLMAASALGFSAGIGILGKLLAGYAADRWPKRYIAMVSFVLSALAMFALMQAWSLPLVWAFVVLFGLSMGGPAIARPLMVTEHFGQASFGAVYGWVEFIRLLGATIGPFVAGWVYDVTQSYNWAFIAFILCFLAGIVPLLWLKPAQRSTGAVPA